MRSCGSAFNPCLQYNLGSINRSFIKCSLLSLVGLLVHRYNWIHWFCKCPQMDLISIWDTASFFPYHLEENKRIPHCIWKKIWHSDFHLSFTEVFTSMRLKEKQIFPPNWITCSGWEREGISKAGISVRLEVNQNGSFHCDLDKGPTFL